MIYINMDALSTPPETPIERKEEDNSTEERSTNCLDDAAGVKATEPCSAGMTDSAPVESLPPVLLRLPNTAFGIPMGLAGHAVMWKTLQGAGFSSEGDPIHYAADVLNQTCWFLAAPVAGAASICYLYKMATSFPLVMAEYLNEVRCHFFVAPNVIYMMLLVGLPSQIEVTDQTMRILWALAFVYQVLMTTHIYMAWMFSKRRNFTEAKPQFLLSTTGWFLLASLGQICEVRDQWGIGLPQMCFGAGLILYVDLLIFIFGRLHENMGMKGSPSMFLVIAPPSVGVVALDLFDDDASDFSQAGEMLLGWVFVLLMLLIRLGPILWRSPSVLGEYWAYVFPIAAATSATIRYASSMRSTSTVVLAVVMIAMAVSSLIFALGRMTYHMSQVRQGKKQWADPVFRMENYYKLQIICHE